MLKVQRKTAVLNNNKNFKTKILLGGILSAISIAALASSHREAPSITTTPKVDGTDFYMFNSYEADRSDFVTLIANYQPLQDGYGGPNYFSMDPNALYEIHISNDGDAQEEVTFQFRFKNTLKNFTEMVGGQPINTPLIQRADGTVSNVGDANLNLSETYGMTVVRNGRRSNDRMAVTKTGGSTVLEKPVDNIGSKTIPDYAAYAAKHIHNITIPGCNQPAKVFVGQRQEAFAVNLGVIFDRVNASVATITDPALIGAAPNTVGDKNVTSIALEVHKDCLVSGSETVIGGWTTASLRQTRIGDGTPAQGHQTAEKAGGAWVQVSRLGMPLVNEVVIGLKDKDRFNASKPANDTQFLNYVTNPTFPTLVSLSLLNNTSIAPTNFPRTDLVTVFLTGIAKVNQPANVQPSEMLRLNTAIPAVPFAQQNRLGIVGNILAGGSDNAGYPNGRRPKDDIVDISLIAVMGGLCVANGDTNALGFSPGLGAANTCNPTVAPLGTTAFDLHDAVDQAVVPLLPGFPYLNTPIPGAR